MSYRGSRTKRQDSARKTFRQPSAGSHTVTTQIFLCSGLISCLYALRSTALSSGLSLSGDERQYGRSLPLKTFSSDFAKTISPSFLDALERASFASPTAFCGPLHLNQLQTEGLLQLDFLVNQDAKAGTLAQLTLGLLGLLNHRGFWKLRRLMKGRPDFLKKLFHMLEQEHKRIEGGFGLLGLGRRRLPSSFLKLGPGFFRQKVPYSPYCALESAVLFIPHPAWCLICPTRAWWFGLHVAVVVSAVPDQLVLAATCLSHV